MVRPDAQVEFANFLREFGTSIIRRQRAGIIVILMLGSRKDRSYSIEDLAAAQIPNKLETSLIEYPFTGFFTSQTR